MNTLFLAAKGGDRDAGDSPLPRQGRGLLRRPALRPRGRRQCAYRLRLLHASHGTPLDYENLFRLENPHPQSRTWKSWSGSWRSTSARQSGPFQELFLPLDAKGRWQLARL
ncbi:MAG: hypothetical protein ACLSHC_02445 [Bilophila wadsworthia]